MWLVEAMGADAFREKIGDYMGVKLRTKVEEKVSYPWRHHERHEDCEQL